MLAKIITAASATLLATLALLMVLAYLLAGFFMNPPNTGEEVVAAAQQQLFSTLHDPETNYNLNYEEVAFTTEDGLTIRGWYVPAEGASKAIISVPGGKDGRKGFLLFLESWHQAKFNVLMIDPRSGGQSDNDGYGMTLGLRESRDVHAAVKWLKTEKANQRIGAIGISQGGASVLQAAAVNNDINAVVLLSTGYDIAHLFEYGLPWLPSPARALAVRVLLWRQGLSVMQAWALKYPSLVAAPKLTQPALQVQGDSDPVITVESAKTLFDRLGSHDKQFWLIPGLGHTLPIIKAPEESVLRITNFFEKYL